MMSSEWCADMTGMVGWDVTEWVSKYVFLVPSVKSGRQANLWILRSTAFCVCFNVASFTFAYLSSWEWSVDQAVFEILAFLTGCRECWLV
jgi:hypothetical protein